MALESDSLGSSIGSTSSKLCTLGQVTESLSLRCHFSKMGIIVTPPSQIAARIK